jgi:hypothetical protein
MMQCAAGRAQLRACIQARSAVPTIFTWEQTNGGQAIGRFASARFAHPTAGLNYVHIP